MPWTSEAIEFARSTIKGVAQRNPVVLAAITLTGLSAVLFALGLNAHEIGRDEAVSVLLARRPVTQALALLSAHEPNPAGYFVLLHLWPHSSALAARLLSYLPAVCIPGLTFITARQLSLPAWTAGLLTATSPFLAYYAGEARMYSWLILFGTAALLFTARALRTTRDGGMAPGLALGTVFAAGLYVHYFAAFTCVAAALVLLACGRRRTALVAVGTTAVLFAPGAVMLFHQLAIGAQLQASGWQSRVDVQAVFQTFSSLLAGTGDYTAGVALAPLLIVLTALALRRATAQPVRILVIFLACGLGVPLLLGVFVRLLTPRYLAASLPVLLLLCTAGLTTLPPRIARLLTVGLLLGCTALIFDATGRFDGQKLEMHEALGLAQSRHALPAIEGRLFATSAAFYAPGAVAYAFPLPSADSIGLWALPPGAAYPPPDHGPIVFFDYCSHAPAGLVGYRFETRTSYPGGLCLDLETYAP